MTRTERPRVLHVITRLIVGGAQLTVKGLCDSLTDRYDIRVLCGPETGVEGSLHDEVRSLVPLTVLSNLRRQVHPAHDGLAMRALRQHFASITPDIIHTHSSKAGILGRLAAPPGVAVVHTIHGWGHTPVDPWWRRTAFVALERIAARNTDALIAVSGDVRDEGLRLGIGTPAQYVVSPEYVDYEAQGNNFAASRQNGRERLGIDPGDTVVGWVGRFVPQKDPTTLVESLGMLFQGAPSAMRAVLIGDGPLRKRVEEDLAPLGHRVVFTGRRSDVRELYPAFDVLIHVSRWEGQPRVVQEAVAERVPVVATTAAGVSEIIINGRTGYVVPSGDGKAVASRVSAVLSDPGLRAPLTRDAVAEVASRHGHRATVAHHIELYERLLGR